MKRTLAVLGIVLFTLAAAVCGDHAKGGVDVARVLAAALRDWLVTS